MEIIKMGKNTKQVAIKLPNTVKKEFEKYVKALDALGKENVPTAELVMASWLDAFKNSEEYLTITTQAKDKAEAEKQAKAEKKAEAEAKRKADAEEKRLADIEKTEKRLAELYAKGQKKEDTEAQAEE